MIDMTLLLQSLPSLLRGAALSLIIATFGSFIGMLLGVLVGIGQTSRYKMIAYSAQVYAFLLRGTPMLIQIFMLVYVLPQCGIAIPKFWAVVLAIGLNSSAYVSFIVKSGIQAISSGTLEAAYVLGFSRFQTMRFIVLPQALRMVLPSLGNECITLIKDSSLASLVGITELTQEGRIIMSRTYDALTVYTSVALIYLALTTTLSFIIAYLETRWKHNART